MAGRGECGGRGGETEVDWEGRVVTQLLEPGGASRRRSPRRALRVDSDGVKTVSGESVVLEVTAEDRCGNSAAASYDPSAEPSPLCDVVLEDGSCCPAIGRPGAPGCDDVCGEDGNDVRLSVDGDWLGGSRSGSLQRWRGGSD